MTVRRDDARIVLTLDAGGSSFRFTALQGGRPMVDPLHLPTYGEDLQKSLATIRQGFEAINSHLPSPPVAMSFAFPGPASYDDGVIGDLANLPGYRGGVALGAFLEDAFGLPVIIGNDADLFTLGESLGGILPALKRAMSDRSARRMPQNLFGITLGTGCGGGLVIGGRLHRGDNGQASEIWQMQDHHHADHVIEECLSIRGIRKIFADYAKIPLHEAPMPADISRLAEFGAEDQQAWARQAWHAFGTSLGDMMADVMALLDASIVIGGGLSGAYPWFASAALARLRSRSQARTVFDLETSEGWYGFLDTPRTSVAVPGGSREVSYAARPALGVGRTRMGTSQAIWLGAYAMALDTVDYGDLEPHDLLVAQATP